ncbi:sensor histidine kinase [Actinomadura kijaniata]|uniref:sensor histidine kinase n=1 Tax=Actinomadura kijaniata TaxID=46161 RepID=UPI00082EA94F|nr:sensor histidine kinase [Actinomadura kijaniata]
MRLPRWAVVDTRRWSLARRLLGLQAVLVALLVAAGAALAWLDAERAARDRARQTVTAVAATIADAPHVGPAVAAGDPGRTLQPFAERVRADTGVDFITIMSPAGIRYTHPDPRQIGHRFLGNTGPALAGRTFSETYAGTLGPSVRAVAPVRDGRGRVVGLVAAGITVRTTSAELRERLVSLTAVAAAVLLAGIAGSYLLSRQLRRQTRGMAPGELRGMFDYYAAILHSVHEGLLLVDREGRVALCNDAARDLLDLGRAGDPRGRPVSALGLAPELAAALAAAELRDDEIHLSDTRVLVVNAAPVTSEGRAMGHVVTLRDHTELQSLTGELDSVRGFAESLRAQAHEAANRLHTVVSLVEMGRPEQAVEFATAELADAQRLTDQVVGAVAEPVLAALLLGKSAEAAERGVELRIEGGADQMADPRGLDPRDLVTVLGNLVDNAVDAAVENAAERSPRVTVAVRGEGDALVFRVSDSGPGVDPAAVPEMFRRGWTTKPAGNGLGLALVGQAVRRHGGTIEVDGGAAGNGGATVTVRLPTGGGASGEGAGG